MTGFTRDKWLDRIRARPDLTAYLTHLTRRAMVGDRDLDGLDVLIRILRERRLKGTDPATGLIFGTTPAVCLFDVPLHSIVQDLVRGGEAHGGHRGYDPFGLSFPKPYLFRLGARPVVYDRAGDAGKYLPEDQHWRIVHYDLHDERNLIDPTHEREWRVPGSFEFEIAEAVILLPNGKVQRDFARRSAAGGEDVAPLVRAVVPLNSAVL